MEEATINSSGYMDRINKEAPELVKLLKEMKEGLDTVRAKIESLTAKVKEDNYLTADGISYLEAKHLLLLNYCQSLVYYLLRKAKGFSIEGHPVVRSLVEMRLFLEKIRPIDKKLQYQIQKLTMVNRTAVEPIGSTAKKVDKSLEQKDILDYRPKPEFLLSKTSTLEEDADGVYRPPKFAPTNMEDDEKISKEEKNAKRKEKHNLRRIRQSDFVKDLIDDHEGRPEEISENLRGESRELREFKGKFEDRMRREEELFTRAPLTREEKKQHKYMKRTQNGVQRFADEFFDDLKKLPVMESASAPKTEFESDFNHDTVHRGGRGRGGRGRGRGGDSGGNRNFKKHKSKY